MIETRKFFSIILSLILPLLFSFSSLYSDANISGKVIDSTSAVPIAGVKVLLNSSLEATTDSRGVYQFLNVSSGQHHVQVEPPLGYVIASANPLVVNVASSNVKACFSLGIPGDIVGSVIDSATNLPIVNANVDIMRGNNIIASVLTDKEGNYSISGLAPRPYIVRVRMPYFQSSLQLGIPVSNQTISIHFVLQFPPGKVIGHVFNAMTGEPLGNATVEILDKGVVINSVQSNEDGSYMISEVAPESYEVRANAPNFQVITQKISLLTNQTFSTDFSLEPFGTVIGQVVHAFTGQPIEGASVGMWQNDELFAATHTDANGCFNLNGLEHSQIVVQALRFYDQEQGVQILSLQTTSLNFSLVCVEPPPPPKVRVTTFYKRVAHQVNRIHCIKWKPSYDPSVTSYRIYRDEKCIAEVSAKDQFVFNDEWRSGNEKAYHVTAVNAFGQEGKPLTVKLIKS